ncbi:MAG TPA: endonuclease I, partial [Pseudoalteromonas shioyasakiensis]|nr:endonuclease I [Pseudoalteromonas shioyasakiensis]
MLASSLLCLASSALANVNNASFESWSANTPASWSTIDSGISLSANTNVVYSGNYSAQVLVNTGTQSNTDLQQLVEVVAG